MNLLLFSLYNIHTVCNDHTQVLNEASVLLSCSLQWRSEPFRCKGKEAGCRKSSHAVHMQSKTLSGPDARPPVQHYHPSDQEQKEMNAEEEREGKTHECCEV